MYDISDAGGDGGNYARPAGMAMNMQAVVTFLRQINLRIRPESCAPTDIEGGEGRR
ncbi:hypothetical protein GCM10027167_77980 [Nocardia heshunensis]